MKQADAPMNSYHVINYTAGTERLSSHRTHEEATKAAKLATAANIASGLHEPGEHDEIKVWSGTMRDLRVALGYLSFLINDPAYQNTQRAICAEILEGSGPFFNSRSIAGYTPSEQAVSVMARAAGAGLKLNQYDNGRQVRAIIACMIKHEAARFRCYSNWVGFPELWNDTQQRCLDAAACMTKALATK